MKVRVNQVLVYNPTALDIIDAKTTLKAGDVVKVINVRGCPKANVMGHCYVGDKDTGKFIGMVSTNSLCKKEEWAMYQAKKSVLSALRLLGSTIAPKAAYENVPNGHIAWDQLVESGHIEKDDVFYTLSNAGRAALSRNT